MSQERDYYNDKQNAREYAQDKTGHEHVKSYYQALKYMPRKKGVIDEFRRHLAMLEMLDAPDGNMYYSEKDEFFVDNWSIQSPELYHRHKEFGNYMTIHGMEFMEYDKPDDPSYYRTHVQWDAAGGVCGLCDKHMPGEIMMMHNFYKLP